MAVAAPPAAATRVGVPVVNEAAPVVRIVSPRDGARLVAGREIVVRVEAEDADEVAMVVDGVPTWSGPVSVLQGSWAPEPGPHRLVAVAERKGSPDAVAFVEVVAVAPAPAAPAPTPPGPAPPPPGVTPGVPDAGPPPGVAPGSGTPPAGSPQRPRPAGGDPTVATPPPPGSAPTSAGDGDAGRDGDGSGGRGGPFAALGRLLSDPEKVAWTVAFPLLLIVAAGAYALLQRYIDGGQKLAWRGRGTPDDTTIEF